MDGNGKPQWEVLESRIDWLTATSHHGEGATELLNTGLRIQQELAVGHGPQRPSYFEGYAGSICNGCFAGWRTDGACIRLSGNAARDHAMEVAAEAGKVTRIDLAVTARLEGETTHVARAAYEVGCAHRPKVGKPPEVTHIMSRSGGETTYFGVRASERYGRLYNKTVESKGRYPATSWRYEIEYKHEAAEGLATWLQGQKNHAQAIAVAVGQRYFGWGITLPFPVPSNTWRDRSTYARTDNETRMKWLADSVAPSLERLTASYSREQLLRALGLWLNGDVARGSSEKPGHMEAT